MEIRAATANDLTAIWQILEPIIRAGETYCLPRHMSEDAALAYWLAPSQEVFIAVLEGRVAGTYSMRANQQGGGAHVANCGYAVHADFAARGVASAMCQHSLQRARERGFSAMQFNFVVSTNTRAVALWQRMGFHIAGNLPGAFAHPKFGYVDALVMYRAISADGDVSSCE